MQKCKWFKIIILIFGCSLLFACAKEQQKKLVIPAKVIAYHNLVRALERQDVQVIRLGEYRKLIVPNNKLYINGTANFTSGSRPVLNMIDAYLRFYNMAEIKVLGSSTVMGQRHLQKVLASARAHKVAAYLWQKGIGARFVYATDKRNSDKIEICFRRII